MAKSSYSARQVRHASRTSEAFHLFYKVLYIYIYLSSLHPFHKAMVSRRNHPCNLPLFLWLQLLILHNSNCFQQPLSANRRLQISTKDNVRLSLSSGRSSSSSNSDEEENKDNSDGAPELNFLERCNPDSDGRPRRINRAKSTTSSHSVRTTTSSSTGGHLLIPSLQDRFQEWGVETIHDPNQRPNCPNCMNSVAQDAFHAISSTLYCKNLLDPNIATNAMALSITDRRPVGFAYWPQGRDVGRLGIEIDGARHLLSSWNSDHSHLYGSFVKNNVQGKAFSIRRDAIGSNTDVLLEGKGLRIFSLILASKLNQWPWDGLEDDTPWDDDNNMKVHGKDLSKRPVALFYNTIRQALQASQELKMMQQISKIRGKEGMYENIRILCLGQDDIPKDMMKPVKTKKNNTARRRWGKSKELTEGKVDPTIGVIMIVQPTDRNNEATPPSPSVGTLQHLQKLLARATIAKIPTVVISPRLTEQMDGRGIEQSGYQKSSTYGGVEPPKGPTPWILRDFIPPVFSWIGSSIELTKRPRWSQIQQTIASDQPTVSGISYLSRVAMTQSIMESGHPWHIYAVENIYSVSSKSNKEVLGQSHDLETNYHYVASTRPKAGRPSKKIILDILLEWTPP